MKKLIVLVGIFALAGLGAFAANDSIGHDVTMNVIEVVAIDLNNTTTVTLSTVAPTNPGDQPTGSTDNAKRIWYTTVNASGTNRNITINWDSVDDAAPAGTHLEAEVTAISGGAGSTGSVVAGGRTVTDVGQTIVTGIGSCYTGRVNGATLQYRLIVDAPASLVVADNHTVNITLTLTDAS